VSSRPDRLMTVEELAAYLRKPVKTIYQWNSRGDGPPYFKVGRSALYHRSDVDQWLGERRVGGTAA
jgi:excisionase family DNA binding protein